MGPGAELAQRVATALRGAVEVNEKGRVLKEKSIENAKELFKRIKTTVDQHSEEPDLWAPAPDRRGVA